MSHNSSLVIAAGSKVYLKNKSQITIDEGSSLALGDNVQIIGEYATIPHDETNPEIPGNRISVYGTFTCGTNVSFLAGNGQNWDGLYLYNTSTVLNLANFTDCNLHQEGGTLSISQGISTRSSISTGNVDFQIDDHDFIDSESSIYCYRNSFTSITNSVISGSSTGITLNYCSDYVITNCIVSNRGGNGISITETNGTTNKIKYCVISNNQGEGIRFYHSIGDVVGCTISQNNKGIVHTTVAPYHCLRMVNSTAHIPSIITGRRLCTLMISMMMNYGHNTEADNQYENGSFDQYLVFCLNLTSSVRMKGNYWGYSDAHGNAVLPPASRFYPSCINPQGAEIG